MLSSAPWLTTLTRLTLSSNDLGAPGHHALSLLHLPRLRDLWLWGNGLDCVGLAALVSAPWLTQLTQLHLTEEQFASAQSYASLVAAIEDDAWVFVRLRRLGCDVDTRVLQYFGGAAFMMPDAGIDHPSSDDELGSGGDEAGSDLGSDPGDG